MLEVVLHFSLIVEVGLDFFTWLIVGQRTRITSLAFTALGRGYTAVVFFIIAVLLLWHVLLVVVNRLLEGVRVGVVLLVEALRIVF